MRNFTVKDILTVNLAVDIIHSLSLKVFDANDVFVSSHEIYQQAPTTKLSINVTLPEAPRKGDAYIQNILDSANELVIAPIIIFNGTNWQNNILPDVGDFARVINADEDNSYQYYSTGWEKMTSPNFLIAD